MRLITLPVPTSRTSVGPLLSVQHDQASVRYDCEDDEIVRWVELVFTDVIRIVYRASAVCLASDVHGSTYVVEEDASPDLHELSERWKHRVGSSDWARALNARAPFRLYQVYFDDAAFVEVVARGVRVVNGPSS